MVATVYDMYERERVCVCVMCDIYLQNFPMILHPDKHQQQHRQLQIFSCME